MKYADKHKLSPNKRGICSLLNEATSSISRGDGDGWELVEADAGYVGGFDGVGCVVVLFREGNGEVLDAVFDAESLKEDNEVAKVFDEVVISFVSLDVTQEDYVVGKIEYTISMGQNNNCY